MYHFQNCESSSQSSSETDIAQSPCTCCKCKNDKEHLTKGTFGLAYIVETPKVKMTTPVGWKIEFEDTPSGVINDCNKMVEWVNYPPLENCKNHSSEYPPACAKILKPRNCCMSTPKKCQCVFKSDKKDNGTNTYWKNADLLRNKNCVNICNFGEKSTQKPSKNSCCHQNSRQSYDNNQACCFNTDHPMHYQGCYWYTDKDIQHCWCTTQNIGIKCTNEVETKDDSTSYNAEQTLDYVPSRESKNNSGGQIIRVVNRETQYQDKLPPKLSTDSEKVIIKKFSDKQVGTNSKEGIRVSIDKEMIARSSGALDDSLNEDTLEKIVSIAKRAIKNGENSNRSLEGVRNHHGSTITENSLEKIVSNAIKDGTRSENSNRSSTSARDNRSSVITYNSLEKIISSAIKDGIRSENSNRSSAGARDKLSSIITENSLEKIVPSAIKDSNRSENSNRSSTVTEHSLGQAASSGNRVMKEGSALESMQHIQNESSVRRSIDLSDRTRQQKESMEHIQDESSVRRSIDLSDRIRQQEMSEQEDKLLPMLSGIEHLTSENFKNVSKDDMNSENMTPMQKLKMAMKMRSASQQSKFSNKSVEVLSSVKQEKSELDGKIVPSGQEDVLGSSDRMTSFVMIE